MAYQVHDVIEAMEADSGIELNSLKVDGGASANNFIMQTQADMIQVPVKRPVCVETTAMGQLIWPDWLLGIGTAKKRLWKIGA